MPALVQRFNEHTLALFKKHGIDIVLISQTELGENSIGEVVYVVRWDSYQQLQDGWSRFLADPKWQRVKSQKEQDGPLNSAVRRRLLDSLPLDARSMRTGAARPVLQGRPPVHTRAAGRVAF